MTEPDVPSPELSDRPDFGVPGSPRTARVGSLAGLTTAWLVIVAVIALVIWGNQRGRGDEPGDRETAEQVLVVMTEMQGRYLYGASQLMGPASDSALLGNAREMFGRGSLGQRMRLAVLVAAFESPESAREEIVRLWSDIEEETLNRRGTERPFELSADDEALVRDLDRIFLAASDRGAQQPAAMPSDDQIDEARRRVRAELGWFGVLAASLGEEGDADAATRAQSRAVQTFLVAFTAIGLVLVLCFAGFLMLVIMVVLGYVRRTRGKLSLPGHAPHGIYAETFACWMVLFVVCMGPGASLLVGAGVPGLIATTIVFFLSLTALLWPLLRGIPMHQLCADIGLTRGASLPREVGAGIAGYVMGLPFLAVGATITFMLMLFSGFLGPVPDEDAVRTLFPMDTGPAHPIVGQMADANIFTYLQLLLVASVAAPVVEEIMFRGVLYRHLRDASGGGLTPASIPVSVVFSAFIFAAVHPQGWMGVPALMGLAIAFALAREWRGSLIAPIIMHGISNGLVMTMLALLVAG